MSSRGVRAALAAAIWFALLLTLVMTITAAATSPLLAWRGPIYIIAGFAGVIALCLTFVQPLLAGGALPGLRAVRGRRLHRVFGGLLLMAVVIHVACLWITSPADVIDALTFTSPTPFSDWGVIAMWAVFATALLAMLRRRLRLRPRTWRIAHICLASVIVVGSVVHAMLVEGTMGPISKAVLCVFILVATVKVVTSLKPRTKRAPSR